MASEDRKIEAVDLIAEELDQLADYKKDMDGRVNHIFLRCGINDKLVQRAILKAAQALSKNKLEEAREEAEEVSNLCMAKIQPLPLFDLGKNDAWECSGPGACKPRTGV